MKTLQIFACMLVVDVTASFAQISQPASDSSGATQISAAAQFGFRTVEEALSALKADPTVTITITKPDSWVIANQSSTKLQWSFTPPGHYAHPMVVKRAIKADAKGDVRVETTSLCQAEKTACEKLLGEFTQMNEALRASVQKNLQQQADKK